MGTLEIYIVASQKTLVLLDAVMSYKTVIGYSVSVSWGNWFYLGQYA